MKFDVIVIGSGPGGYVAAIRSAQLGYKTAVVEKADLGGVCLNWGCIPTKALLRSAEVLQESREAVGYGLVASSPDFLQPDIARIVARSREVSATMNKGIAYLFKKNGVEVMAGEAHIPAVGQVRVGEEVHEADRILIATGARAATLPFAPIDGKYVVGYREALVPESIPESLAVIGSGAIGVELAWFYHSMGTKVTIIEFLDRIVPTEDEEVSATLSRCFRKAGIKVMVSSGVQHIERGGAGSVITVQTKKGVETLEAERVLSAVGIRPNTEGLRLEELGVEMQKGRIVVDGAFMTSVPGIYAIGDVIPTPALAHVASAEALCCVEQWHGMSPAPVAYDNFPACIFTSPQIASCGLTEKAARDRGLDIKIGKFPFTASGKATAQGHRDGFVKIIADAESDKVLGIHLIGDHVSEMIGPLVTARSMGVTASQLSHTIYPHPTMSEGIMEAAAALHGEAIHI